VDTVTGNSGYIDLSSKKETPKVLCSDEDPEHEKDPYYKSELKMRHDDQQLD
jgi:hypothetical protein